MSIQQIDVTTVFVLMWKYADDSGFGAIRFYFNEDRAKDDLAMLEKYGDTGKKYWYEQLNGYA